MSLLLEELHDDGNDTSEIYSRSIQGNDEPVVRAGRFKDFVERFFGSDVLALFEDDRGNNFRIGE